MPYYWILKPRFLVFVPLLVILLIAVACGDDATPTPLPQPTATAVPPAPTATPVPAAPAATSTPVPAAPAATSTPVPAAPAATSTPVPAAPAATPTREAMVEKPTPVPVPTATPRPTPAPSVAVPQRGGIVPMLNGANVRTWDPHEGINSDIWGSNFSYNQMLEFDPMGAGEIVGDLAESWSLADDQLSYTLVLRKGVKWTDGKDVTIDDVVFSLNRMMEEGTRPSTGKLKTYLERVEKIDENSVKLHMKFPSLAFLRLFATDFQKILPQHHLETGVKLNIFGNSVGSGPFMDVKHSPNVLHEIERNPDYFKAPRPYFDGIKRFLINDKGTEIAAFQTERVLMHQLPFSAISLEEVAKLESDPEFSSRFGVFHSSGAGGDHLMVNSKKAPYTDPRVRRAIHLALYRQPLVEGFGLGQYTIGKPMSPNNPLGLSDEEVLTFPGYRELDGKKHPDDIAEAQRLMAEAGFPGGKGFKAEMVMPTVENYADAGQVIAEQLRNTLGLDITVRALDIPAYIAINTGPDFEMALSGASPSVFDPDFRFQDMYTDTGRNWSHGFNPEVVELFNKQTRETDPVKRKEIAQEMERKVLLGSPYLMEVYWKTKFAIVSNRIKTEIGDYVKHFNARTGLKHEHEWLAPE